MMIDTHCHIYLPEFEADQKEMISKAENEGVKQFLMPAIDSTTHEAMIRLAKQYPGKCLSMMGLHPCSVKESYKTELKTAREYLSKSDFVAIGETGLDFYWDLAFTKEQYMAFNEQIEMAMEYNIPVVIHSRNSIDECIKVVDDHQTGRLKGVFHCFSGNIGQANRITDLGLYLGIGGVITFKNSGLDKVVKELGLEHIVLETDSPYLAPVPFRGKRNECSYLKYVAGKISEIKGVAKEEVEKITTLNAKKLFGI